MHLCVWVLWISLVGGFQTINFVGIKFATCAEKPYWSLCFCFILQVHADPNISIVLVARNHTMGHLTPYAGLPRAKKWQFTSSLLFHQAVWREHLWCRSPSPDPWITSFFSSWLSWTVWDMRLGVPSCILTPSSHQVGKSTISLVLTTWHIIKHEILLQCSFPPATWYKNRPKQDAFGLRWLNSTEVLQMCGRAGRRGLDLQGHAIVNGPATRRNWGVGWRAGCCELKWSEQMDGK